eukprot:6208961-Pleurochrysis_carterae.AAC.2
MDIEMRRRIRVRCGGGRRRASWPATPSSATTRTHRRCRYNESTPPLSQLQSTPPLLWRESTPPLLHPHGHSHAVAAVQDPDLGTEDAGLHANAATASARLFGVNNWVRRACLLRLVTHQITLLRARALLQIKSADAVPALFGAPPSRAAARACSEASCLSGSCAVRTRVSRHPRRVILGRSDAAARAGRTVCVGGGASAPALGGGQGRPPRGRRAPTARHRQLARGAAEPAAARRARARARAARRRRPLAAGEAASQAAS